MTTDSSERWLYPSEAARLLHIDVKTLARHAKAGRIPHRTTLGGHRRYLESDILAMAEDLGGDL